MIEFGFKDAWERFEKTYTTFLERWPRLAEAIQIPMRATIPLPELSDRIIFFLASTSIENFLEILLLCGNGYGFGAMTLLRGMYERAVVAYYLHEKPAETKDFVDYYWVNQQKLTRAVQEVFGKDSLPALEVTETEENSKAVRHRFEVLDCKTCGTTRLNHTWTTLDFVSMAKRTPLGKLIVTGYVLPTQQAHSTMRSMLSHVEEASEGKFFFVSGEKQDAETKLALITAHNILLSVLTLIRGHFNLPALDEPIRHCVSDFEEMWKPDQEGGDGPSRSSP